MVIFLCYCCIWLINYERRLGRKTLRGKFPRKLLIKFHTKLAYFLGNFLGNFKGSVFFLGNFLRNIIFLRKRQYIVIFLGNIFLMIWDISMETF